MMDLRELVLALNEYIGRDKYDMHLGTNGAPAENDNRIVCTANIGVVPYGYTDAEIGATSLNITFTFDLHCGTYEDDAQRDIAVADLTEKLLDWHTLTINNLSGTSYTLNTFFEMLPMSNPYVDDGRITQQLVIAGKALLQKTNMALIVGNDEKVSINNMYVLVVDKSSSTQVTHEPSMALSQDSFVPELKAVAYTNTLSLTCIFRGSDIDKELWKIGEGVKQIGPNKLFNPNDEYTIRTQLQRRNEDGEAVTLLTTTKTAKLVSVTNSTSVGTFIRYQAVFQIVE